MSTNHEDVLNSTSTILDEIDHKILELLRYNSRISYTDIGKIIGLSRVAVHSRVTALVESGVIEQFTISINSEKIGFSVSAFFNVDVQPEYLQQAARTLAEDPAVVSIYHMTGPSTLHMHGLFKTNKDLEVFLYEKLYAIPGIVRVDSQMLLKRYKSRIGVKL